MGWGVVFVNDTATTEIYTLSLHDALPILEFTADSPTIYQLVGLTWEELPTTRTAATHTVTASVSSSGSYQVAAGAPEPEVPAWHVNGDGTVNIIDLVSVATLFGKPAPAGNRARSEERRVGKECRSRGSP